MTVVTGTERTVPDVLERSLAPADRLVRLLPQFTGTGGAHAWVHRQSPQAGIRVSSGSTVTMALRTGPRPIAA
jgi:beta-lactam-binding protein with PASTA domain